MILQVGPYGVISAQQMAENKWVIGVISPSL